MAALWMHDASLHTNVRLSFLNRSMYFSMKIRENYLKLFITREKYLYTETAEDVCGI